MKDYWKYPTKQSYANAIARAAGYGKATEIIEGPEDKIVSGTSCGYRKYTTGQYVPQAYLKNFGWKNTYYQSAETVVSIRGEVMVYFTLKEWK